ncbi:hypothetical protein [Halobacterium wangiae]|uniref:hypothetical protein n=1 Tax=Halobacterium wangiae TaxID=2902623 RepID=UPI001E52E7A1|nr:hypothetical protein [Halobacterium wangiae]
MNNDLALELLRELRDEYEEGAVIGEEVRGESTEKRGQESFKVLHQRVPIPSEWLRGDSIPAISRINLSSVIAGFHQAERWFLLEQLDSSEKVPDLQFSKVTHNNLLEGLSEVFNPTHIYIPQSDPFLSVEAREAINTAVSAFDNLECVSLHANDRNGAEKACYAICSDRIHMNQCTRLPLDQSNWLPARTLDLNRELPEHPLYCAYGSYDDIDTEYALGLATIPSENPTIRNNAAVKISFE